jgi:hypothetical protein
MLSYLAFHIQLKKLFANGNRISPKPIPNQGNVFNTPNHGKHTPPQGVVSPVKKHPGFPGKKRNVTGRSKTLLKKSAALLKPTYNEMGSKNHINGGLKRSLVQFKNLYRPVFNQPGKMIEIAYSSGFFDVSNAALLAIF